MERKKSEISKQVTEPQKGKRIRRGRPFPAFGLEASMAIARSIAENNACKPYSRLSLAGSIDRSPESSAFRQLISSSAAYGLTEGSYIATQIKITDLGLSIVAPKNEKEKRQGLIKAAFSIELFKKLYEHFDQHRIPPHENFKNTLIRDYELDASLADECINQFKADGKFVGLIRQIAGEDRISIHDAVNQKLVIEEIEEKKAAEEKEKKKEAPEEEKKKVSELLPNQRVFITHGKNQEIVKQLKDLLTFGRFIPVVAEEHETTSKPVSEKVLEDMRSCFAGIIHVESEDELLDRAGNVHHKINENVLIEIGAAFALYRGNFILLVQKGIHLPSNLQGLYRCEYEGSKLDYDATMKLLKAFSEFK
jgi:predicted nucleotide-binding protein